MISCFKELRTCSAEPGGSLRCTPVGMKGEKSASFWVQIYLGQELQCIRDLRLKTRRFPDSHWTGF